MSLRHIWPELTKLYLSRGVTSSADQEVRFYRGLEHVVLDGGNARRSDG